MSRVTTGVYLTLCALVCLACLPVVLFSLGVSALRDRIEARWPDSDRARAVSFWLGLLAPLALGEVPLVFLLFAIARPPERDGDKKGAIQDNHRLELAGPAFELS
jgi:hypothetical protein